jgi:hypothetical protein
LKVIHFGGRSAGDGAFKKAEAICGAQFGRSLPEVVDLGRGHADLIQTETEKEREVSNVRRHFPAHANPLSGLMNLFHDLPQEARFSRELRFWGPDR